MKAFIVCTIVLAFVACVFVSKWRMMNYSPPAVVWVNEPPRTVWLTSESYLLEQAVQRYQPGLRSDGVVVWRPYIVEYDGIHRGDKP